MTVELRPEDQAAMQAIVNQGHFASVDEAIHAAVQTFSTEHQAWLRYVREAICEGEEDIAAGRVIDEDTFFRELHALAESTE